MQILLQINMYVEVITSLACHSMVDHIRKWYILPQLVTRAQDTQYYGCIFLAI